MEDKNSPLDGIVVKLFIRGLTGIILAFYVFYAIVHKWKDGIVNIDADDWALIGGSMSVWLAFEAVREYLKKKLNKG